MNLDTIQNAAHEKLSRLKAGALFMKMGTGKTKVALDLATSRRADFDAVIWIAPASLIEEASYLDEIARWNGSLGRPIHFFSVEGISMSDRKYLEMHVLAERARTFCIVDESITVKNTEAGRTRRLLDMWNLFAFRLILNGTPVAKGLIDLYAQIQFIHPGILKMTEAQFANHFLTYRQDGWKPWKRWSKPANEAALVEMIRPYIFDADLDLPVRIEHGDVECPLTPEEAVAYAEFKEAFLKSAVELDFLAVAQAFQSRYTVCEDKLSRLMQFVRRHDKTIVYVKFLKEVDAIRGLFPHALVFTGKHKDDLSLLRRGRGPLICTYGTGSMGLNLQWCDTIAFFSQTFDWKDKAHARARVCRTGQDSDVAIQDFWVPTGLERIIRASLDKKGHTAANIKRFIERDGAMAL